MHLERIGNLRIEKYIYIRLYSFLISFGQLGSGDSQDRIYPTHLKSLNTQRACYISCGEDFTAVLTRDGGVFTFGAGMYGQLGHNSTNNEGIEKGLKKL